jgi:hypothetical protein
VVWLQEWRLRGDRMGLLSNSIDYCTMVLQKLSERWAVAGFRFIYISNARSVFDQTPARRRQRHATPRMFGITAALSVYSPGHAK